MCTHKTRLGNLFVSLTLINNQHPSTAHHDPPPPRRAHTNTNLFCHHLQLSLYVKARLLYTESTISEPT